MKALVNKRRVFGVGLNDADYPIKPRAPGSVWCPYYIVWASMLRRAYSKVLHKKQPRYIGCTVCPEWLTFSKFKNWMLLQDWQGKQLDKDILLDGNMHYSPENCVFVSGAVNKFLTDRASDRGLHPIGVVENQYGRFIAKCGKVYIGVFLTTEAAHNAWGIEKLKQARSIAASQLDARIASALIRRFVKYETDNQLA